MKRKIYDQLLSWKNTEISTPLMIIGARQVGKTHIINEFCQNEFEEYVYIDLLAKPEIINIFEEKINLEEKWHRLELFLEKKIDIEKTIIFFDEIQESEKLINALKYFAESKKAYKIICAGSLLGVKIHRFQSSFPVGKVRMLNMYPMDFEEFLWALDKKIYIAEINKCFNSMKAMDESIHKKLLDIYNVYLCIGGMPEAVFDYTKEQDILSFNDKIIKNIIDAYLYDMNKYVKNIFETSKIEAIYRSIPTQLANPSNKFQYSKISEKARARYYIEPLKWLISSNMIIESKQIEKPEIPLKAFVKEDYFKLYLSDVGLMTTLLELKYSDILLNKSFTYRGILTENYVANQLLINGFSLYYWQSANKAEVDFTLYTNEGIIPVEVKSSDNTKSYSLNVYIKKYNPKYSIRLSTKNFGFENQIKSIPLYAAFCIKQRS